MEIGLDGRAQRLDRAGLGQARRALDQQVAVGQQGDQQALDQQRLADHLVLEPVAQLQQGGV